MGWLKRAGSNLADKLLAPVYFLGTVLFALALFFRWLMKTPFWIVIAIGALWLALSGVKWLWVHALF